MSEEKFCKKCGKQISEDFKLCPYCGEKVEEEILEISCPSCGKTIKSDFKVCPYCGNNPNYKKENSAIMEETNLNTNQSDNPLICKFCGKLKKSEFQICPYCGNNSSNERESYNNYNMENRANYNSNNYEVSPKSGIACLLLWLFLGELGVHRFYAGKTNSGIIMLILFFVSIIFIVYANASYSAFAGFIAIVTAITLTVWWIIDLVSILRGKFQDSKGRYIKLNN